MTRDEVKQIVLMFSAMYPSTYGKFDDGMLRRQIDGYYAIFRKYNADVVKAAAMQHIKTSKFAPVPSSLISIIESMERENEMSDLWREAWSAICGNKKFGELSRANQRWFKDQKVIDSLGQSEDTIESVLHGQYLKEIPKIIENISIEENVGPEIMELAKKEKAKRIGGDPGQKALKGDEING